MLELQDDGKLTTSDDPPVVFGSVDGEFIQKVIVISKNYTRISRASIFHSVS